MRPTPLLTAEAEAEAEGPRSRANGYGARVGALRTRGYFTSNVSGNVLLKLCTLVRDHLMDSDDKSVRNHWEVARYSACLLFNRNLTELVLSFFCVCGQYCLSYVRCTPGYSGMSVETTLLHFTGTSGKKGNSCL